MNNYQRISRGISLVGIAFGLLSSSAYAQQANIMQGRIWDFSSTHPDFETGRGGPITTGQVASTLGPDGKPVWAGSPNAVFSSPEAFDQWYRDVPGINLSKPYSIELVESPSGSGNYTFDRYNFFPIDNEMLGNEGDDFLDQQGSPHNFHYTMQLAGEFSYQSDSDTFTFIGDDDLWVFFGGRLGIDLGGVHAPANATITGAQLRELGLTPNQSYPIDIFFAERQTDGSNFVIQTNFNIQPPTPERVPLGEFSPEEVDAQRLTLPLPPGTELVRGERYWSPTGEHFLTLNPDGNLVVAKADGGYVWGFDTQPDIDFRRVFRVVWQEDGNLAAYAEDGGYIWSALTQNPDPNAQLTLQPDGRLQIAAGDQVLWSSAPATAQQVQDGGEAPPPDQEPPPPLLAQTNTGRLNLSWSPDEPGGGTPVAFISTDGTATEGSRSVFILQNEATGESTIVPVLGEAEATLAIAYLEPGTYTVVPPPPSIGQFSTFTTRDVSATQITVPEIVNAAEPAVTVSFSLGAEKVPVGLFVDKVSATQAELSWDALPGVTVAEYVLVLTSGSVPASTPEDGTIIPIAGPTATSAIAEGLMPSSMYSFALFATSDAGESLPVRSFTATTANPGSTDAAFAMAPNAILPVDFERLEAERVGPTWVRVTLDPDTIIRGSNSAMPALDTSVIEGGSCVVGTPLLVTTDVAGDNSFYGVIDVCESSEQGVSKAIVNTDVPLNLIFSYYHLTSNTSAACYNPVTGEELALSPAECVGRVEAAGEADAVDPGAQSPTGAGSGALQITMLWATGDDLDLHVTEPDGAKINWEAKTSAAGGMLDLDDRGADCGVSGERAENIFWGENAANGIYTVDVVNHKACATDAEARIQVRVDGDLVIDQVVSGNADSPIRFSLEDAGEASMKAPNSLRRNARSSDLPRLEERGRLPVTLGKKADLGGLTKARFAPSLLVAQVGSKAVTLMDQYSEADSIGKIEFAPMKNVSCEGAGNAKFDMRTSFGPIFEHDLELSGGTLTWDVEAGLEAGINPDIEFGGEIECSVEIDGWSQQLSYYPIPVTLGLTPDIKGTASATVKIDGPKLALRVGVRSVGEASASIGWRGFRLSTDDDTTTFMTFERGDVSATVEGTLGLDVGGKLEVGVGIDNFLTSLSTGMSFGVYPVSAELKAVVGTSNCVAAELGAKFSVGVFAKAYVLGFGKKKDVDIFDSGILPYPEADFEVGDCPENSED